MEKYKVLTKEDLEDRTPKSQKYDFSKLTEEQMEYYLNLTSFYYHMLNKYVASKLGLQEYDDMLKNSPLNFVATTEENMDLYQSVAPDEMSYFYVRNNVYIERLTKEERHFFRDRMDKENIELDDEMMKKIEETMPKVISEATSLNQQGMVNFGPSNKQYYAPLNSLVIGFRYNEFDISGCKDDDEWDVNHSNQREQLGRIIMDISSNSKEKFNVPLSIIEYNEFSVKKKQEPVGKKM